MQHPGTQCNTLEHNATQCNTCLPYRSNGPQKLTFINTLQHNTTQCHTLQHIAIHCNILTATAATAHSSTLFVVTRRSQISRTGLHFYKKDISNCKRDLQRCKRGLPHITSNRTDETCKPDTQNFNTQNCKKDIDLRPRSRNLRKTSQQQVKRDPHINRNGRCRSRECFIRWLQCWRRIGGYGFILQHTTLHCNTMQNSATFETRVYVFTDIHMFTYVYIHIFRFTHTYIYKYVYSFMCLCEFTLSYREDVQISDNSDTVEGCRVRESRINTNRTVGIHI